MKKVIYLMAAMLVILALMLCGCKKEETKQTTDVVAAADTSTGNVTEEQPANIEELATFVPEYKYSEGYEEVTSIVDEELADSLKIYTLDKSLSDFNGAVLVAVDDTIVYANGFGYADEAADIKNDIHTTFEIGWIAMGFTAEAVYKLNEEGLLDFDTTIDEFFPGLKGGKKITVENLLKYTSGLPSYFSETEKFAKGDELKECIEAAKKGENLPKNFLLDYLTDVELVFEPGTDRRVNCTDYYLLGMIIELVSGMSYEDYIYSQVLAKNGMQMTNLAYKGASAQPISVQDVYNLHSNVARGYCTGNSSVIEMYKWLRHICCDVLYDYDSIIEKGMSGYAAQEANTDGYYFLTGLFPINEIDSSNPDTVNTRENMIYIVMATNDADNVNKFGYHFNFVKTKVQNLKEQLAAADAS